MTLQLRAGLAAVAALAGLSANVASAQPLPEPPKVIRYPGGSVVLSGSDVIVRQKAVGQSTTVVQGAGNGIGNRIVVDGGPGGLTVVTGSRLGIGNKLVVNPDDLLLDLDEWLLPAVRPAPAPACYKGKANAFWEQKAFSEAHDCNLYWCPKGKQWFRYHADGDVYRPVADQPAPPAPLAPPLPPAGAPEVMPR